LAEPAARFAALVKDASEFLAALGLLPPTERMEMTVTYQDPCHLAHGQKIRKPPRQLLAAIPGLRLVEMEGSDRCCGSAGIYNITHPEMSMQLLQEKMTAVSRAGAQAIVAPNPGCMVQLRAGGLRYGPALPVYHLMDLLDRAYGDGDGSSSPSPDARE
jgi:glycolate oxidase iron-sulfur subunit